MLPARRLFSFAAVTMMTAASSVENMNSTLMNGKHHVKTKRSWTGVWTVLAVIAAILVYPFWAANRRRRLYNSVRAFYKLAVMPSSDWDAYYKSLDVMAKDHIESAQDERLVAAWYRIINLFCDLGELEKMYIPPMVNPELGLEDNQLLIENKMALGATSESWNSSLINTVGETLAQKYKNRYVVHSETGEKLILPLNDTAAPAPGYETRPMEILDLGCGKGRVAHHMMHYTGGKVTGMNIDDSQLKNAIQFALDYDLWPHRLNFMYGSFNNKLPFEDESLDFCYEIGAFTYLIDKVAVFKEIFRVLRPGGAFCYNDWTLLEGYDPNDPEKVAGLLKIKKLSGLIELHDPNELAAVAEHVGFQVIWNDHGGHLADPSIGLLTKMQKSFWFADFLMNTLIQYKILPSRFIQAWQNVRPSEGKVLKQSMNEKWLDVGHIFLIKKPYK